jgi:hypothetical protein
MTPQDPQGTQLQKFRVLGRPDERQRIDGQDRMAQDIVEMSDEAAAYYLREGRIEPVEIKVRTAGKLAAPAAASETGT